MTRVRMRTLDVEGWRQFALDRENIELRSVYVIRPSVECFGSLRFEQKDKVEKLLSFLFR